MYYQKYSEKWVEAKVTQTDSFLFLLLKVQLQSHQIDLSKNAEKSCLFCLLIHFSEEIAGLSFSVIYSTKIILCFTVMEGNILATWTLNQSQNNDLGSVSYYNISCDIRIGK